jgi:hypothetical protein
MADLVSSCRGTRFASIAGSELRNDTDGRPPARNRKGVRPSPDHIPAVAGAGLCLGEALRGRNLVVSGPAPLLSTGSRTGLPGLCELDDPVRNLHCWISRASGVLGGDQRRLFRRPSDYAIHRLRCGDRSNTCLSRISSRGTGERRPLAETGEAMALYPHLESSGEHGASRIVRAGLGISNSYFRHKRDGSNSPVPQRRMHAAPRAVWRAGFVLNVGHELRSSRQGFAPCSWCAGYCPSIGAHCGRGSAPRV